MQDPGGGKKRRSGLTGLRIDSILASYASCRLAIPSVRSQNLDIAVVRRVMGLGYPEAFLWKNCQYR
jgi:hypothetical protein